MSQYGNYKPNANWYEERQKKLDAFNKRAVERWAENEVKKEMRIGIAIVICVALAIILITQ